MVVSKSIQVMISSRCLDTIEFEGREGKISDLRIRLKKEIEDEELFDKVVFSCWINEDAPSAPADETSWEHCLLQAKKADVLIVLYNGNPGWSKSSSGIGICHAELETALASGAAKVRLVELPEAASKDDTEKARFDKFRQYISDQDLFRGRKADNGEEAIVVVKDALQDAVIDMVHLGVREARKGKYDTGQALDWIRLTYLERKRAIEEILASTLGGAALIKNDEKNRVIKVAKKNVVFCCHGIPAGMGVAAAREMVGRPFLKDHEFANIMKDTNYGPVHVIGCHKNVTENQAVNVLGFPDATIVKTIFGIYIADNIQKIQLAFLADCRDESSTRHAVQRFLEWLNRSGEAEYLAERAESRHKIIRIISQEAH